MYGADSPDAKRVQVPATCLEEVISTGKPTCRCSFLEANDVIEMLQVFQPTQFRNKDRHRLPIVPANTFMSFF
jgi:hypothetical protein